MSQFSLEELSSQVTWQIRRLMVGKYTAILLVGAAARNEITIGPDGRILSDLDFLVVTPTINLLYAYFEALRNRKAMAEIQRNASEKYNLNISIGIANSSSNYWSMATPFNWELRENALLLDGDSCVKQLPAIKLGCQLPEWEGVRLLANRICELMGSISMYSSLGEEYVLIIKYAALKLALAWSEAMLIKTHHYQSTYRARQFQHEMIIGKFSIQESQIIHMAYQAKLNQNYEFYKIDVHEVISKSMLGAIDFLKEIEIGNHPSWMNRGMTERPKTIGLVTDLFFYFRNRLAGRTVPIRHAILSVYADAIDLAEEISSLTVFPYSNTTITKCRDLYYRFIETPQFVSVIK